ncbi:MAG: ABC transporter ATP-binding protein [Flavobacteriaceae bacterium]|jgi:ABC-2 type transport system ATP-binding protein|tara:strand:- start:232 stop:930 length:699 start_codon:yes stop_codon:yes gene_type:complete
MISFTNVSKVYAKQAVLDILLLEIPKGQTFGLVGNNGAGKTTMFSCLLDLIKPSKGVVKNNNVNVRESEDWKSFTSAYLDESFLIGYLMPEEYFYFIGELRGVSKREVDRFLNQFEDLFNGEILKGKKYIRDLSKGNQKKVGIVAALIGEPEVIILDEPFANLDPTTQIRLKKIIKKLSQDRNITVLISSHDLQDVTEVSERIVLLEKGKVVRDIKTSKETLKELESYFTKD